MANKVLLKANGYASLNIVNTNKTTDIEYKLLSNQINTSNTELMNAIIAFVVQYNTFISVKFPKNKMDYLIITDKQVTEDKSVNSSIITDIKALLTAMENKLDELEKFMGFTNLTFLTVSAPERHSYQGGQWRSNLYANRHGLNIKGFIGNIPIKSLLESESVTGWVDTYIGNFISNDPFSADRTGQYETYPVYIRAYRDPAYSI